MLIISSIYLDNEKLESYLIKKWLLNQFLKALSNLKNWNLQGLDFKLRKPKKDWTWSFRINKQFRAFWYFREWEIFVVNEINNHQNF